MAQVCGEQVRVQAQVRVCEGGMCAGLCCVYVCVFVWGEVRVLLRMWERRVRAGLKDVQAEYRYFG